MIIPSFRRKQQSQPVEKVFSAGWKTRYKGVGAGRLHPTGAWEAQYPAWRHVGMPPYGVWRGCDGNRRPGRAADSRPYGVRSARPVGRGAHTPPKQAAGTKESASIAARAWRHVGMPPSPKAAIGLPCTRSHAGRCGHRPLRIGNHRTPVLYDCMAARGSGIRLYRYRAATAARR